VFFLRYSVQQGWLQPPVRVAIGIIVAIGLLLTCELKAARRYPATANAMDASAIAILFATFLRGARTLAPDTGRRGLRTAGARHSRRVVRVGRWLSIRRESLFIAVLGLLGGFATPALLSTGENRPIPLFRIPAPAEYRARVGGSSEGLAGCCPWLTVALTAVYQWGWVFKFLTSGQLSLAMGVFLLFPLVAIAAPGARIARQHARGGGRVGVVSRAGALVASVLPLFFAVYLAVRAGVRRTPVAAALVPLRPGRGTDRRHDCATPGSARRRGGACHAHRHGGVSSGRATRRPRVWRSSSSPRSTSSSSPVRR
jgi:hypothetical protein